MKKIWKKKKKKVKIKFKMSNKKLKIFKKKDHLLKMIYKDILIMKLIVY